MNLNILFTFMLYVALEKNRVAFSAFAYALACSKSYWKHCKYQFSFHDPTNYGWSNFRTIKDNTVVKVSLFMYPINTWWI